MDLDLIKLLEQAGFTEKEARVYLALLELGQGDVTDIAKLSDLKRSIIYVLLEGLTKRGYVSEVPNKKINTYKAIDPLVISHQLKATSRNFFQMLPILRTLQNKGIERPKISYYETKDGILNIYEEMAQTADPFYLSSYSSIKKTFPNIVEKWIEEDKKEMVTSGRHLIPNNPENIKIGEEFKSARQQIRVLNEIDNLDIDFTIFGNKLAITSLEETPFITVIESERVANSILSLFNILWKNSKEM